MKWIVKSVHFFFFLVFSSYLCTRNIKSSRFKRTRQPSFRNHGGQGTMWKIKLNFKNILKWKRTFYHNSLHSSLKHLSLHFLNLLMHRLETMVSTQLVLHTIMLSSMSLFVVALMCLPFLTDTQYLLLIM